MRHGRRHRRQDLDRIERQRRRLALRGEPVGFSTLDQRSRRRDSPPPRAIRRDSKTTPQRGAPSSSNRTRLVAIAFSFSDQIARGAAACASRRSAPARSERDRASSDPTARARAGFRERRPATSAGDNRASLAERMAWITTPKTRSKPTSIEKEARRPSLCASRRFVFKRSRAALATVGKAQAPRAMSAPQAGSR